MNRILTKPTEQDYKNLNHDVSLVHTDVLNWIFLHDEEIHPATLNVVMDELNFRANTKVSGIAYFEVTIRVPADGSTSNPDKWAWEEILGHSVEVIDSKPVNRFKSPDFQRVYEETMEELYHD